jgi:hypothetical protein
MGSFSRGSEIQDGYPEFTVAVLKRLGWYNDLTPEERASIERVGGQNVDRVSWSTDLSGGIIRSRWSMAATRRATPRPAPWRGTCRTPCRSTASRSTRRAPT